MLAFELGEESWQLGFSTGLGQQVLRRKMSSRCTKALLCEIAWARKRLGLSSDVRVVSCYEAGRDGFWLHRFLEAQGIENFVMDSASILAPPVPSFLPAELCSHFTSREYERKS